MVRVNRSTKSLIASILEDHISKWYSTLQEVLKSSEDVLMSSRWIPYLKSVECEFKGDNNSYRLSIKPNIWYYPDINPFLRITTPNGRCINFSDLFKVSEAIIDILKSEGFKFLEPSVRSATQELILLALESKNWNLPPLDEIKKRVRDNVDKFLERALSDKIKVLSVAPLVGCDVDCTIRFNNDCILRPTTREDISVMVIARGWNFLRPITLDLHPGSPVLVAKHEIITPEGFLSKYRYYDEEAYVRRLHDSFKRKTDHALLSLRLYAGKPIGYGLVYHVDDLWNTPKSIRITTEEPYPTYKIVASYEIEGKRPLGFPFLSNFNRILITNEVKNIYNKIKIIYKNNKCEQLRLALEYYSKSMRYYGGSTDEFEIGCALLCLTNSLESICRYLGGRDCTSSGKIVGALKKHKLLSGDDVKLIKDAYRIRSEFFAHSFKQINTSKTDLINIMEKLYELIKEIIQDILKTT